MLIEARALGDYRLLGETRDDAAGEAFDKSAKLLGLPYPGGPQLAELAERGHAGACDLPRPMLDRPGFAFSFSGLKTAVALAARAQPLDTQRRADIARGLQDAIVDTLCTKALRALDETGHRQLVVAGGVGANRALRARLAAALEQRGGQVFFPRPEFCTDNAAMIAIAGLLRLKAGERSGAGLNVRARWPLDELRPPPAATMSVAMTGVP